LPNQVPERQLNPIQSFDGVHAATRDAAPAPKRETKRMIREAEGSVFLIPSRPIRAGSGPESDFPY